MPTYELVIPPIAISDLEKIVQFGRSNWGDLKAHQYIEHLKNQFQQLTIHPKLGILRDEILPGIRSLGVDSHVIFYRIKKKQIEIIRILHGRQEPKTNF